MSRNAASRVRGRAFHTHDASRLSSQFGGHPALHALQGLGQRGGIGAAGHGHVGLAAAFAAYLLGNEVHEFACLDLAHSIFGHASGQLHFVTIHGGEHDGSGFEFVFEFIERVAQGFGIDPFELGRQHFEALHVDGLLLVELEQAQKIHKVTLDEAQRAQIVQLFFAEAQRAQVADFFADFVHIRRQLHTTPNATFM